MEALREFGFAPALAARALTLNSGNVEASLDWILNLEEGERLAFSALENPNPSLPNDDICDTKMVVCVRTDLSMGVGKMCSQTAHAAVALCCTVSRTAEQQNWLCHWQDHGSAKIVVQVSSEKEMSNLCAVATSVHVPFFVVCDAGKTQVDPGTCTSVGFGPAPRPIVDRITGSLRLL